ncbi:hypothetical protein E8E14_005307 [Neopestalotiopsis sp. 37M]|nr:hypothetical protein E8E14_005307 [Neopestalotiopsis sp. 37M]
MEDQYAYRTLPPSRGIRLLRLLPSEYVTASLRGCLIEYSLEEMYTEASSYDALSYVWGDPEMSQAITIDGLKLPITANLQVALMHLRHRHVERLLWVDQLCIDQNNEEEKENQITLMSQIYACANCVIVWLGEEKDDSDCAMEDLRTVRREWSPEAEKAQQLSDRVSRLLQRAWFHRIWVLQEVGVARRVQIRCGRSVIDGHLFAMAAEVLRPTSETCSEDQALHSRIQSAALLIRQSIFRSPCHGPPTPTDGICTFGELVDMFHNREATKCHDKIYALLGMSSSDMDASDLLPDYTIPFGHLFERLIKFVISDQLTVECQDDKEAAVFKGRGLVLGTITGVMDGIQTEYRKRVVIEWRKDIASPTEEPRIKDQWGLRIPAIPLREGDFIVLLEGAAKPSIIRVYEDFWIIIVAVAMLDPAANNSRPWLRPWENSEQVRVPRRDFVLIWDWHYSIESYSHLRRYTLWAESKGWVSANSSLIEANRLDDLARFWECATAQWEGHQFEYMRETFKACFRECEEILHTRALHTKGREHIMALIYNMIGEPSTTSDSESGQHVSIQEAVATWFITYLFHLAAEEYHNNMMDFLIGTGHVNPNLRPRGDFSLTGFDDDLLSERVRRDSDQTPSPMTPLQAAAWKVTTSSFWGPLDGKTALQAAAEAGSLAIVERLLEMGADINAPAGRHHGKTALQVAAKTGNMVIVDCLLRQNADVNAPGPDTHGRTALQAAAEAGHLQIIKYLLEYGANINAPAADTHGRTALQAAAEAGHLQIVEYLLEYGANINAPAADTHGRTALQAAAEAGHLQIVEYLLEQKADVNAPAAPDSGRTALQAAAEAGHLQIVKWLLEQKADVNAPAAPDSGRTALQAAAEVGHLQIVEYLLEHKADVNAPAAHSDSGRTALQAAAGAGHLQIVKWLLEQKADVNAPAAPDGRTALQAAVGAGHLQIVKWLLEHKADVNAPSGLTKGTALQVAAGAGYLQIVEWLLEHKADVNALPHWYGNTAIQAATSKGHFAIIHRLKEAEARRLEMQDHINLQIIAGTRVRPRKENTPSSSSLELLEVVVIGGPVGQVVYYKNTLTTVVMRP